MPETTPTDDLRTIREAMKYYTTITEHGHWIAQGSRLLFGPYYCEEQAWGDMPDPTANTPEGLAEFARMMLWACKEFPQISIQGGNVSIRTLPETEGRGWRHLYNKDNLQAAFITTLAAAIRTRGGTTP